MQLNWFKS